jgi:hypothetical protein
MMTASNTDYVIKMPAFRLPPEFRIPRREARFTLAALGALVVCYVGAAAMDSSAAQRAARLKTLYTNYKDGLLLCASSTGAYRDAIEPGCQALKAPHALPAPEAFNAAALHLTSALAAEEGPRPTER